MDNENKGKKSIYSKKELEDFVLDIEKKVDENNDSVLHSILALNHLLREPNTEELVDDSLKTRMKDLWVKLDSFGFELNKPPLLFGFEAVKTEQKKESDEIDDGTKSIVIKMQEDGSENEIKEGEE